jgi:transcriptional regulator with XRE-family HTH domain
MKKLVFDNTISVDELQDAFRAALVHCIAGKPRGVQANIAKFAGISTGQVTNIVKGIRPGTESRRRLIALSLGYEYEDFLALGQSLLKKSKVKANSKTKSKQTKAKPAPTLSNEEALIVENVKNLLLKKGPKAKALKAFLSAL